MLRFFISYSRADRMFLDDFVPLLRGVYGNDSAWFDDQIPGGVDWWQMILGEIARCDIFIYLLSNDSLASRYCCDEFREARDQQYDFLSVMAQHEAPERVAAALKTHLQTYPGHDPADLWGRFGALTILPPQFEWCDVTAGKVEIADYSQYGGSKGGVFQVAAFKIARYPVTNAQYQVFVDAPDGYQNPAWWEYSDDARQWRAENPQPLEPAFGGVHDHPRVNVTWYEAAAFCRWLDAKVKALTLNPSPSGRGTLPLPSGGGTLLPFALREKGQGDEGWTITLPTEEQWQWAAVGDTGWKYPWGNDIDATRCNFAGNVGQTTPVTRYPRGASLFGVMDMSGNVWEWCSTDYKTGEADISKSVTYRVLRGGSWFNDEDGTRADYRNGSDPFDRGINIGFRLTRS